MSQYMPATVRDVLSWISKGKLILPSMQRNFVWSDEKICDLFDSLASGYPIGTFLFWEIDHDKTTQIRFNTFIRDFDESKPIQRGHKDIEDLPDYIAVLDGQQRITSLNIGINGHMHMRAKKRSSKFVDKYLALNVFHDPEISQEETTSHYDFRFVAKEELNELPLEEEHIDFNKPYWIPVNTIADESFDDLEFIQSLNAAIAGQGLPELSSSMATKIMKQTRAVNRSVNEIQAVSYYPSKTDNLSEVVDIFVRVNSGGQKLSSSDLMLAIAASEIVDDPQEIISDAIDLVRNATSSDLEFKADKDLIIRAGLMFTGQKSVSLKKPENYSKEVIAAIFKDHWDDIISSLQNGVKLLEWLGFNVSNLAKNLLLPVAYYLYLKKPGKNYYNVTYGHDSNDKLLIKQWVIRSIVRSIFRDGTGSTLIYIRNVIDASSLDHFPLGEFLKDESLRDLRIGDESIDEIMNSSYGDAAVKPILATLAGIKDISSMQADHMWPHSILASMKRTREFYPNISETEFLAFKKRANSITNLQLLTSGDNGLKGDSLYEKWLHDKFDDTTIVSYFKEACVDPYAQTSFAAFLDFTDKRAAIMRERIAQVFPNDIESRLFPND